MTLAKVKEQDGMTLAKVKGMTVAKVKGMTVANLQHLLESRHLDLRRRTSDFGDFNGLLGSAYPQEKSWDS